MWKTLAESSDVESLKSIVPPVSVIPDGVIGRLEVCGIPLGMSRIFDSAFAEQTIGKYLVPTGAKIIDVYETGNVGIVEFSSDPIPVVALIFAVAAALSALGFVVISIKLSADIPVQDLTDLGKDFSDALKSAPMWIAISAVVLLIGYLIFVFKK